jgi:hypothetical protein
MASTPKSTEDPNKLTGRAKDAADTAVGLGVLGLQKLQVGRVEVQKRLAQNETFGAGYAGLRAEALRLVTQIEAFLAEALRTLESALEPVAGRLPDPARHVASVAQARVDGFQERISEYLASAAKAEAKAETSAPTTKAPTSKS